MGGEDGRALAFWTHLVQDTVSDAFRDPSGTWLSAVGSAMAAVVCFMEYLGCILFTENFFAC